MPIEKLFDKNEWCFGENNRRAIMDPNNATCDMSGSSHIGSLELGVHPFDQVQFIALVDSSFSIRPQIIP